MTSSAFDLSQFGSQVTSLIDPENRIINGAMDFWQRGTSSTANGYGSADRWRNVVAGGTVTMSRQAFSVGDALGSNNPTYFLRQTVSGQTLATQEASIRQFIEGVRNYAGQTITVLGWARRSSGSGNMAVELVQVFGSGGSPSASVNTIGVTTVALTSSYAPFAVTIAVPSIAGKTIGTNGDDYLSLSFWTSAGSNYNARTNSLGLQTIGVDLWGIHIRLGSQTVDAVQYYRQPELGPELARCQRYYVSGFIAPGYLFGVQNGGTATEQRMSISEALPVEMRATPTVTYTFTSYDVAVDGGLNTITRRSLRFRGYTSFSGGYWNGAWDYQATAEL